MKKKLLISLFVVLVLGGIIIGLILDPSPVVSARKDDMENHYIITINSEEIVVEHKLKTWTDSESFVVKEGEVIEAGTVIQYGQVYRLTIKGKVIKTEANQILKAIKAVK